ncbi:MAG TPA: hypothetical protein VIW24_11375 [Aldersonia sp.]
MSCLVLRCGDVPVPIAMTSMLAAVAAAVPGDDEIDQALALALADLPQRIIVLGHDTALAAVLTRMLRTERLEVEIGYVPVEKSPAARVLETGTGAEAAKLALDGNPTKTPLIRDETGTVLVGRAVIAGVGGEKLVGEAYIDNAQLFSGKVREVQVEPGLHRPGLSAWAVRGQLRPPKWVPGRAVQIGTEAAVVTRDGITDERAVRRVTFYRHEVPWLLVQ